MLNKISNLVVNVLINKKSIEEKERPIYLYGAMLLLSTLAGLLSIIVISLIFFDFVTVLFFLIFFIPLRVHAGGYHCKKYSSCFIVSNILFIAVVLLAKISYNSYFFSVYGAVLVSGVTLIMVIWLAPVTNANNRLSLKKKKDNRKKSIFYATIYFSIILISKCLKIEQLDYFICVAAFSELTIVILMVIEKLIERRIKHV